MRSLARTVIDIAEAGREGRALFLTAAECRDLAGLIANGRVAEFPTRGRPPVPSGTPGGVMTASSRNNTCVIRVVDRPSGFTPLPDNHELQTVALGFPRTEPYGSRRSPLRPAAIFASLNHNDLDLVGRQGPALDRRLSAITQPRRAWESGDIAQHK